MTVAAITLGLKYGPSVVAAVYSAIHFHWARKKAKQAAAAKGGPSST
jgi:hypothetical protein